MDCPVVFAWWRQYAPPSNTCFFRPTRVLITNDVLMGWATFAQLTAECPYTLQWAPSFPSALSLQVEVTGPHLMHCSLGPPKSQPKWHFDWFGGFAGLTIVTDQQTDHPTWPVTYIHIHTYIHTNLYSAKIVERIWGAGTGWLGGKSGLEEMRL